MSIEMLKQTKAFSWLRSILELLFLAITAVCLVYRASSATTLNLPWPPDLEKWLLSGLTATALLRFLTGPIRRKETLLAVGFALVCGLVYRSGGYRFLLFMAALTVGCTDIGHRRMLWVYLLSVGVFYTLTVSAGMIGAIRSYIRIKDGLRSSWGLCYPTDFASLGLFVTMILWVAWRKLPAWGMLCVCAVLMMMTWLVAHSYTSTACGMLLALAVVYHSFESRVLSRHRRLRWIGKCVDLFDMLSFPICAAFAFALMILYARGTDLGFRLDHLMSNRLATEVEMYYKYGVKAFGSRFAVVGNGFSDFAPLKYTYLDSSYPLILLRYGWAMLAALALGWGWTVRKAIRAGDRRLALVMGIIAIHSISEQHFIQYLYNILVVMPLAAYAIPEPAIGGKAAARPEGGAARRRDRFGGRPALAAVLAILLGLAALFLLSLPAMLSELRTVLEINGLCGGGEKGFILLGVILGFLYCCAVTVVALVVAARGVLRLEPARNLVMALALLLACACVGVGARVYADRLIGQAVDGAEDMLAEDREALEIATGASTKGVYSAILPAVYKRGVEGMSYSVLFGDDLSRLRGSTVLMDADAEHSAFFDSGCLYTRISERHALYTADRAVIDALTEAGYHLTGYYSTVREVDLAEAARQYKLKYSPKRGVLLRGTGKGLKKGPYVGLYGGQYTVTYELALPRSASAEDGVVCTLSVTANKGKRVLLEKEIRRSQFDGDGRLTVSIPFRIADTRDVAFRARGAKGRRVYVQSIRYARTPDYDFHALYDSRLRKVREEYHTLDGAPTIGPSGYFAVEYGYDSRKNVNLIRYFNINDEPTLHTSGYAELHRVFNANRQVVREEYYGTDGRPITLVSGAAANEREYDSEGNAVVNRYYGIDGRPTIVSSGYAEVRRQFDEEGNAIREVYFGVTGEPIALPTGEYAAEMEYDEAGDICVKRFYGADGERTYTTDGYSELHWQHNGMHQLTRVEFYDAQGLPMLNIYGEAANEREYDDAGNITVFRCYGLDGNPVINRGGYAQVRRWYNDKRQIIREEYSGLQGEPITLPEGQWAVEMEYDGVGNVAVRRLFGVDGVPVIGTGGYAEVRWRYNDARQIVREAFYGTDGEPIMVHDGSSVNEREYDAAGNIIVCRYYGGENEPVVTIHGYAEVRRQYNEKRQIVREAFYGTDGLPMAQPEGHCGVEQAFDDRGNIAVQRFLDADGRPVAICEGYAEVRRTYNDARQTILEAYFDADGAPFERAAGHVAIEQEFDGGGELSLRRYLDAEGRPMLRMDGYSEARWTRDADGVRSVAFYDLNGNTVSADGLNLMLDAPDVWSRWYTPKIDVIERYDHFGTLNLGKKAAGDVYSLQLEIEFANVKAVEAKAFLMRALGPIDEKWGSRNVWNLELVNLTEAPADGVYRFAATVVLDDAQASASMFDVGFCCEHWAGGSYRLRCVKVERGSEATAWSPGI